MMKNKKDDPFGPGLAIIIIISIIAAQVISHKLELNAIKTDELTHWLSGVSSIIYGIIYYIIKNIRK